MQIQKAKTSRAIVLGLIVLCSGLTSWAQTRTAIERMNDRVAEWQKAPTERFVGLEVAFPKSTEEATATHDRAMLLVTIVTHDAAKEYVSKVTVNHDSMDADLGLLGISQPVSVEPTLTRHDNVYYLPLAFTAANDAVTIWLGWPARKFTGKLPSQPKVDDAAATRTDFTKDMLHREFAGVELAPQRVRISSGVAQGNLVKQVPPRYPLDALKAHATGTVVLAATIGQDGHVLNLKLISGPPMLIQAATDAVSQWQYKPYLLNGTPTVVETTITVNFEMSR